MRSQESYENDLRILRKKDFSDACRQRFGTNEECPFTCLRSFDIVALFPFDIAHDLFEGVVKNALNLVLRRSIELAKVDINALNGLISTFPFASLEGNRPAPITRRGCQAVVGGFASAQWTLIRFIALLLFSSGSDLIQTPEFFVIENLILLVVQILIAPRLIEEDIEALQGQISAWLLKVKQSFANFRLKPKFNYLLH